MRKISILALLLILFTGLFYGGDGCPPPSPPGGGGGGAGGEGGSGSPGGRSRFTDRNTLTELGALKKERIFPKIQNDESEKIPQGGKG